MIHKENIQKPFCFSALFALIFCISFISGNTVHAFQGPTAAPPQGNVPAPINVGSNPQYKEGYLSIGKNTMPGNAALEVLGSGRYGVIAEGTTGVVGRTSQGGNAATGTLGGVNGSLNAYYGVYGQSSGAAGSWGYGVIGEGSQYGLYGQAMADGPNPNVPSAGVYGIGRWNGGATAGVVGTATTVGVLGNSAGGTGVFGDSFAGAGVKGNSDLTDGVYGDGARYGVHGQALSDGSGQTPTAGVYGEGKSGGSVTAGVYGKGTSSVGVRGKSDTGTGVEGFSDQSIAGNFDSTSNTGVASKTTSGSYSVYAKGGAFTMYADGPGSISSVYGLNTTGAGLWGTTTSGIGAIGLSSSNYGTYGVSTSGGGAYGQSSSYYGVEGISGSASGVRGYSSTGPGGNFQSNSSDGVSATAGGFGTGGYFVSPDGLGVLGIAQGTDFFDSGGYFQSNFGTGIVATTAGAGYGAYIASSGGNGVYAYSGGTQINNNFGGQFISQYGPGLYGETYNAGTAGIVGKATSGPAVQAVASADDGVGVLSESFGTRGRAVSAKVSKPYSYGVYSEVSGDNQQIDSAKALYGKATGRNNYGVYAQAEGIDGTGVYARTTAIKARGMYVQADSGAAYGLYSYLGNDNTYAEAAIYGEVGSSGKGYAGKFKGPMRLEGNFDLVDNVGATEFSVTQAGNITANNNTWGYAEYGLPVTISSDPTVSCRNDMFMVGLKFEDSGQKVRIRCAEL
ncbi:hypothetical protein KKH43_01760 [Patescibacteria group bacterium]|nr:hypothetical protein [Patescibacteria group bacterium]